MVQLYDTIGTDYSRYRCPDARIATAILQALGEAGDVVNVGAGTGSYEPTDRAVVAIEPALEMIRQRRAGSAPVVQASVTHLPFRDVVFDAALAVLTVHHWPERQQGLGEMARVVRRRLVLVTWDPEAPGFWLVEEYFPELVAIDRRIFPRLEELRRAWGTLRVEPLLIPHDCTDGFLGAYWQRPQAYLDTGVRRAISTFARLDNLHTGLERLQRDLADGTWERRYGSLRSQTELDLGYRLVVADFG